jgi:general stress protein YciG
MPTGPKGQRRPADVIGNAIRVARIATGEEPEDTPADDGKDKAAQEMGRKGGRARAEVMSAQRRREIAQKGAAKRWEKEKLDAEE